MSARRSEAATTIAEAAAWPEVLTYEDVTVVPMSSMFQGARAAMTGGPIWPDWDREPRSRHFRDGMTADRLPEDAAPVDHVDDGRPYFWIGPIVDHFGHFLAEFSTRILPTLVASPDAVLVFTGHVGSPYLRFDAAPAFVKALLDWYDVPPERVMVVPHATRFRRLSVVPEPELLGEQFPGEPGPAYLSHRQEWVDRKIGATTKRGTVFVTRSRQPYRFGGEAYLDEALRASGVAVVRPEALSLPEQIATYARAETLIVSEGSAIHGLELLGTLGRVIVLARRPGLRIAESKLAARTTGLVYIDAVKSIVAGHYPADNGMRGSIDVARSFSVLDAPALLRGLAGQGIDLGPHWDAAAFRRVEAADLSAFREQMRSSLAYNRSSLRPLLKGLRISGVAGADEHGRWLIEEEAAARGWSGPAGALRRQGWLGYYRLAPTLGVLGPAYHAMRGRVRG